MKREKIVWNKTVTETNGMAVKCRSEHKSIGKADGIWLSRRQNPYSTFEENEKSITMIFTFVSAAHRRLALLALVSFMVGVFRK